MIHYYLVKEGYLVGTGVCQQENTDSIFSDGAAVFFGNPPDTLQPIPVDNTVAVLSRRNCLLAASDWTQLPDVDSSVRSLWLDYRQALRDITDQEGYPNTVKWPVNPVK